MRRFSAASAGRFGEPAFWREFYARKSKSGPFEWFVDADVAAHALQPLLPRSQGGGCRVLHLGCGARYLYPCVSIYPCVSMAAVLALNDGLLCTACSLFLACCRILSCLYPCRK